MLVLLPPIHPLNSNYTLPRGTYDGGRDIARDLIPMD
jgi:hypothetical protein